MKPQLPLLVLLALCTTHCRSLPKQKLAQAKLDKIECEVINDSLRISFKNTSKGPVTIAATAADADIQAQLARDFPVPVDAGTTIQFTYPTNKSKDDIAVEFSAAMGNAERAVNKRAIALPFQTGKQYKIIQGYNGSFSHTEAYSRYALDFDLQVGDTICAAAAGYVVGVISGYTGGGKSKRWRDYANYITLFHPDMNLFTQYVHLMPNGSFVEVDDYVEAGQVIGRSGQTGFTDVAHLHFNVLEAKEGGIQSTPITFEEGYKGSELKRGDRVRR